MAAELFHVFHITLNLCLNVCLARYSNKSNCKKNYNRTLLSFRIESSLHSYLLQFCLIDNYAYCFLLFYVTVSLIAVYIWQA